MKEMFRSWKATKPVSFLKTRSSQSRKVHIRKMKSIQQFAATPQPWNASSHSISRCPMTKERKNYSALIFRSPLSPPRGKFHHDIMNNCTKLTKPKPIITDAHGKSIKAQLVPPNSVTRSLFFDRSLLFWLLIIIISDCRSNLCLFSLWMFSTARRTLNWSLFKVLCLLNFVFYVAREMPSARAARAVGKHLRFESRSNKITFLITYSLSLAGNAFASIYLAPAPGIRRSPEKLRLRKLNKKVSLF